MIITVVLVVFVSGALYLLARAARGQSAAAVTSLTDLQGRTTAVDITAFRNLVSRDEENYLRRNLPASEFKRIQRLRLKAATAYIRSAVGNAAVLLRIGEAAQHSPDHEVAAAGRVLVETAIRLRLYAFFVLLKLHLNIAVPDLQLSATDVVDRYERLTDAMARFTRMQQPGLATRISLSL